MIARVSLRDAATPVGHASRRVAGFVTAAHVVGHGPGSP